MIELGASAAANWAASRKLVALLTATHHHDHTAAAAITETMDRTKMLLILAVACGVLVDNLEDVADAGGPAVDEWLAAAETGGGQ